MTFWVWFDAGWDSYQNAEDPDMTISPCTQDEARGQSRTHWTPADDVRLVRLERQFSLSEALCRAVHLLAPLDLLPLLPDLCRVYRTGRPFPDWKLS